MANDTNHPPETNCRWWEEKAKQRTLTLNGQFAGLENSPKDRLVKEEGFLRMTFSLALYG